MSSNIVLPLTAKWLQDNLSGLYNAKNEKDFNAVFDDFIAHNVHSISYNGAALSRDAYKQFILQQKTLEHSAKVTFGAAASPPPTESPYLKETVGLSFTAAIFENINIHGHPEERTFQSTIIVEVENDPSIAVPRPPNGIHGGGRDTRRVFKLTQVLTLEFESGVAEAAALKN